MTIFLLTFFRVCSVGTSWFVIHFGQYICGYFLQYICGFFLLGCISVSIQYKCNINTDVQYKLQKSEIFNQENEVIFIRKPFLLKTLCEFSLKHWQYKSQTLQILYEIYLSNIPSQTAEMDFQISKLLSKYFRNCKL